MYIAAEIVDDEPRVALHHVDDFTGFKIVLGRDTDPARALAGLATIDAAGDAHVLTDALRALSGRAEDPAWVQQFENMLAYAASAGWTSEGGRRVQAHCERSA